MAAKKKPIHVLVGCFDVSGDHHTANLIKLARKKYPNRFVFSALAGQEVKKLSQSKSNDIIFLEDTCLESSVGLLEGVRFYLSTVRLFKKIEKYVDACAEIKYVDGSKSQKKSRLLDNQKLSKKSHENPNENSYGFALAKSVSPPGAVNLLLCVDGQSRNLELAARLRKKKITTAYFFPPPVFIWGKWNIKKLKKFDLLLCPFLQNHRVLHQAGAKSIYIGHPFATKEEMAVGKKNTLLLKSKKGNHPLAQPLLSIFPGSRVQEIEKMTIPFLEAALVLLKKYPHLHCVISLSHEKFKSVLEKQIANLTKDDAEKKKLVKKIPIIYGKWNDIIARSTFAYLCSGTVTLRAALAGTPHLIAYRISALSFLLGRLLVYVKFIGIANIIANRELAPEFINSRANANEFVKAAEPYLKDKKLGEKKRAEFKRHLQKIYCSNPFDKMLKALLELMKK